MLPVLPFQCLEPGRMMIDQGVRMLDYERYPAEIETRVCFPDAETQRALSGNRVHAISNTVYSAHSLTRILRFPRGDSALDRGRKIRFQLASMKIFGG